MSDELCLKALYKIFQDIKLDTKYNWQAKESLVNNMGWSTTKLQQGRTELYQKTSCLKAGVGHFEHVFK